MIQIAPHLLLRTDPGPSRAAALLTAAGYLVSRIEEDRLAERLAGAPHVNGVVVDLPSFTAIPFARRLDARYGGNAVIVVITPATETVRRAVPSVVTITPFDVTDDLVATVDLALAARERNVSRASAQWQNVEGDGVRFSPHLS